MPIHEYACRACGSEYKKLSVFATQREKSVQAPAGCGTCGNPAGPGACRFN